VQPDAATMERAATRALAARPEAPIDRLVSVFQDWFYLPDPGPVQIVIGALIANYLPGHPAWLLLIAPPGGGKTEILLPLSGLPRVHVAATLTEASLLSGTPNRERDKNSKGGLLRSVGSFGMIVLKDFTSVLSMDSNVRTPLLAALREIHDGSWTRWLGTDGGKSLSWSGKLGLLAGCTPTVDRHHGVMAAMGQRFISYRLPVADEDALTERALAQGGRQRRMESELAAAVAAYFMGLSIPNELPVLEDSERDYLIDLSTFVVRCRSSVERDSYSREIELVPDPEVPGRLAITLAQLLAGLKVAGVHPADRRRLIQKTGLDSIPALRRRIVDVLARETMPIATSDVATGVDHPSGTVRRALEDLTAHRVATRQSVGQGKADLWLLTDWARGRYRAVRGAFPKYEEPC